MLTKVLNVLIRCKGKSASLGLCGGAAASAECLVDNDTVGNGGGDEGGAVGELGHLGVVVEGDV